MSPDKDFDASGRDELIIRYTPLIKFIANRLAMRLPPHIDVNDLISSGVLGLIDAIEKYDSSREVRFKTYAEFRIRGAMLDELRADGMFVSSLDADAAGVEGLTYAWTVDQLR